MISVVQPTGATSLLSQLEAESLSRYSQGDLYDLYRNCSLACFSVSILSLNLFIPLSVSSLNFIVFLSTVKSEASKITSSVSLIILIGLDVPASTVKTVGVGVGEVEAFLQLIANNDNTAIIITKIFKMFF